MKSVGIIGQGFVGSAVRESLRRRYEVCTYDPKFGCQRWTSEGCTQHEFGTPYRWIAFHSEGPIFLCLPTPMKPDGRCDLMILTKVLAELCLSGCSRNDLIIKSTVPPGTTRWLASVYQDLRLVFSPEFLREVSAVDDFRNQSAIIIGTTDKGAGRVQEMFLEVFPEARYVITSSTTAEMVKYLVNCFLATKLSLANEFKLLCDKLSIDFQSMVDVALTVDGERLGPSHWRVPGADGKAGYGGSCFPKDVNALIQFAEYKGVDMRTLKAGWETNLAARPERDWEQLKGRAVSE